MKDDFQFMLITLILNLKMIMLVGSAVMENDKRKKKKEEASFLL